MAKKPKVPTARQESDERLSQLSDEERKTLLSIAREALEEAVKGDRRNKLNLTDYSPRLQELRATFITLTKGDTLRGCIGALEPYLPLVEDVREHAVAAGLQDYRFPPVQVDELEEITIEISCLTIPQFLAYEDAEDLLMKLRVGIDGVILIDGAHRATFLPQVWEKIPSKEEFLEHLCIKMGAPPDLWRRKNLVVMTYQVEEFKENDFPKLA